MGNYINVGDVVVVRNKTKRVVSGPITLFSGAMLQIVALKGRGKFETRILDNNDKNIVIDPKAPRYLKLVVTVQRINICSHAEHLRELGRLKKACRPKKLDQRGCHRPPPSRFCFTPCFG